MADVVVDIECKNPKELIGQGIRAYVLEDYNAAVTALSTASELLAKEHADDLHDSLGEVYLYYGKSLLALSREESEALGDAIPKNAQENEDDEDDDEDEEVVENPEENKTEEKDGVNEGASSGPQKESNGESTNGTTSAENKEGENTEGAPENEDEPTDLEVAWEVLELAKKIYQRHGDEGKKNLAETLIVLGEISLESENFEAAVNDIKEGVEIQKASFSKDSRTVAESLYKLGIAYSTDTQIEKAIECFKESLEYLQNRINHLQTKSNQKEVEDEIKEIQNLLPDIKEKINDMETYRSETLKQLISAVKPTNPSDASSSSSAPPPSSSSKPATDISHLVKRKRKLEETEGKTDADSNPAKKPSI